LAQELEHTINKASPRENKTSPRNNVMTDIYFFVYGGEEKWRKIVLFITSTRKLFNKSFHLISLVIKFSVCCSTISATLINIVPFPPSLASHGVVYGAVLLN
jgi:hypothetical protein